MIPRKVFTNFAKFQRIANFNDFTFPIWLQELLQASLGFLWSFFVLHGYDRNHWVARSCTTTASRWLFRDSHFSLRTLWSAVIKSPKFSARNTAPPLRLMHGAIVILVLWQISQFRSLGKWVWTLCLPKSSRLLDVGSKDTSWEELACESLRSRTSSTKFSLNSCGHSGISESPHGFLRSIVVSFSLGFGILLAWISSGFPDLSSTNSGTGTGEMSLSNASSLSRTDISPTVGGEGEDEDEEEEERLSCFIGVREVDEDAEEELDKAGTTIRTLQIIRIPSLMRCGFFDQWSIHKNTRFHRKAFRATILLTCFRKTSIVKNISNSLTYTIASSCVCTSPLAVNDYRKTARFRQNIHFSITQVLFPDHMHWRTGVDIKFSFLKF